MTLNRRFGAVKTTRIPAPTGLIVHHHNVTASQSWHQELDHPSKEALFVDWSVEHARRDYAVASQAGNKCQRFPMAVRNLRDQPLANGAASMQPCHVHLGPFLIDKNDSLPIDFALMALAQRAPPCDVRPLLLGRAQVSFYS